MREIRFRGKRLDNGEWVYGCLKHVYRNDFSPEITSWTDAEGGYYRTDPVNPNTVGQYTGMKDSDGNEIYEGDIVRGFGGEHIYGKWEFNTVITIESFIGDTYELGHFENSKVIGNIHDNPELLEGGGQE